jgi:TPR repeat protein
MTSVKKIFFCIVLSACSANAAYTRPCQEWFESYQQERLSLSEQSGGVVEKKIASLDIQREKIFLQCEAEARQGNVSAQEVLARLYFNGIGTGRSMSDAHYWYIIAAKNGSKEGAIVIANAFLYGEFFQKSTYNSYYWNLVARKEFKGFEKEFCNLYRKELSDEEILLAEKTIKKEYNLSGLPSCKNEMR